jgi:hypothetical protein
MHLKRLPLLFMVIEKRILYLTFRRQKIYKVTVSVNSQRGGLRRSEPKNNDKEALTF